MKRTHKAVWAAAVWACTAYMRREPATAEVRALADDLDARADRYEQETGA